MKLWDLIVWNQRFRKIKNSEILLNILYVINKKLKSLNWFDKNKFKEILAIIDRNEFNYKNKIGEFKYIGIKDLVNNNKNNTISEIDAKKKFKCIKRNKKRRNNKV